MICILLNIFVSFSSFKLIYFWKKRWRIITLKLLSSSELNPGPSNTVHVIGDSLISGIKTSDSHLFNNCDVHCYRGKRLADISRSVNGFSTDRWALRILISFSMHRLNPLFVI